MESKERQTIDEMDHEATRHVELGQYDKAEQLYRNILTQRLEQEGIPATYRDMYNLAAMLVNNQKYEEAIPMLRELFIYLSQRATGRDRPEFMEQETATARLLAQSLEGRRQLAMAKESRVMEEGLHLSDSSEDDEDSMIEREHPKEEHSEVIAEAAEEKEK